MQLFQTVKERIIHPYGPRKATVHQTANWSSRPTICNSMLQPEFRIRFRLVSRLSKLYVRFLPAYAYPGRKLRKAQKTVCSTIRAWPCRIGGFFREIVLSKAKDNDRRRVEQDFYSRDSMVMSYNTHVFFIQTGESVYYKQCKCSPGRHFQSCSHLEYIVFQNCWRHGLRFHSRVAISGQEAKAVLCRGPEGTLGNSGDSGLSNAHVRRVTDLQGVLVLPLSLLCPDG